MTISAMDPEGARALAQRIAAGPPREDGEPKPEPRPAPPSRKPPEPPEAESSVEIVYVKAHPARRRDVRIYVRGEDGRLERGDP
jgi:hypothetical protein